MDIPPPAMGHFDIQVAMHAVTWTLTGISICAVGTRVYLRRKLARVIDPDDWIMVVAVIIQIAYQSLISVSVTKGVGKTMPPTTTPADIVEVLKWSWFSNPLAVLVSVLARLSIAVFLVRIFGVRTWFRDLCLNFTTLLVIIGIVNIVIVWFQASPVEALWDFRIPVPHWDPKIQQTFSAVLHAFLAASDLFYVVFPVAFVWKLNTPVERKIQLSIVLALSIITFGIALAKLVLIIGAIDTTYDVISDTADVFYIFAVLSLISGVEQNLVIILGSAPKLRSITALQTTLFSSIGSDFRSLMGSNWRKKDSKAESSASGSKPYPEYDRAGYSDLEMQPNLLRFDKVNHVETSAVRNPSSGSADEWNTGTNIRRTDNFIISEGVAQAPRDVLR